MPNKEFKVVPYEHTLYSKLIENLEGQYFQNIRQPHLIAQIPKENSLGIHYIEGGKLSAWFPLLKRHGDISLEEFDHYALISEEQFNEYKNNKTNLQNLLIAHKDSKFVRDKNKHNLSAIKGIDYEVDKKDAGHTTDMSTKLSPSKVDSGESDFLHTLNTNYYFPSPTELANLAFNINETAKLNKQNKHNLSANSFDEPKEDLFSKHKGSGFFDPKYENY